MIKNNKNFTISESIPSNLTLISGIVSGLIKKLDAVLSSKDDVFHMKVCLTEALVNAIKHGNGLNQKLNVGIVVTVKDQHLMMAVSDQGQGFDFHNILDPSEDQNLVKTSGRGIFLIQKYCDSIEFKDGGRVLEMIKYI